jgi:predicted nucleotidyltransferase
MSVRGDLLRMLEAVAEALGDELLGRLVFVGGCSTALFITDDVTLEEVRATDDVDLIVDLTGFPAWAQLQEELKAKGFRASPEDDVICRMRLGSLKVDFMPDDEAILGFSNRWYRAGIETAEPHRLSERFTIRRLTPALFLATKLEAWIGRGRGDMLGSRDLEDILLLVDGRPEIVDEVRGADRAVRDFVAEQVELLLVARDFEDFLAGNLRGPVGRERIVRGRFVELSRAAG